VCGLHVSPLVDEFIDEPLDPKKRYQESAEAFMRVEALLGLRDAILVAITTMERLRIRPLDLGWAPLMLELRESLSFS